MLEQRNFACVSAAAVRNVIMLCRALLLDLRQAIQTICSRQSALLSESKRGVDDRSSLIRERSHRVPAFPC